MAAPPTATRSVLLALADQRLPAGGHVHSGGIEQAIVTGLVRDAATLRAFLQRRLLTAGLVAAGIAAAATGLDGTQVPLLDAEVDSRVPSPAQREASRAQGRGLLRLARAAWAAPHPGLAWHDLGARPHHPVVLGCCARAAGLTALDAASVAAYLALTGPATAAQRLLGLDPVATAVVTLDLGDVVDAVAVRAAAAASGPWADLPDACDPLLDVLAQTHAARGDRLFAS